MANQRVELPITISTVEETVATICGATRDIVEHRAKHGARDAEVGCLRGQEDPELVRSEDPEIVLEEAVKVVELELKDR